LFEPLGYKTCFVVLHITIMFPLDLVNPLAINNISSMTGWNKMSGPVLEKCLILFIHSSTPLWIVYCFMNMLGFTCFC
jgi:hypothetical protein